MNLSIKSQRLNVFVILLPLPTSPSPACLANLIWIFAHSLWFPCLIRSTVFICLQLSLPRAKFRLVCCHLKRDCESELRKNLMSSRQKASGISFSFRMNHSFGLTHEDRLQSCSSHGCWLNGEARITITQKVLCASCTSRWVKTTSV